MYLKISNGDDKKVNLVFAKNRISPIKEISIPRLELLGVLIGCRISKFVSEQLLIPEIKQTILTDSKCVLEWYKSNKELKRFVNDKIKEIRTYDTKIGYVKSKENPADIATRGVGVKELFENKLCWKGSDRLIDHEINSELYELEEKARNNISNEEKGSKILHEVGLLNKNDDKITPFGVNIEKYSSHTTHIRVTAWCLRCLANLEGLKDF